MDARKLRIVFMGTPGFAVPSLTALVEGGYDVAAVITSPDRPAGRGLKVQESEVKSAARALGIGRVLQPERLKDESFLADLRALRPDLGIVIAFRMLPEAVWAMPRLGTFNLHASLLPEYRGAAPINWAIINGETQTGVTTFMLNREIDRGAIVGQIRVPIDETDTAGSMYGKLMHLGSSLVIDTVELIAAGEIRAVEQPQSEVGLHPAPKIFKNDCAIDWHATGKAVVDFIRGLSPYPAAWSRLCRMGTEVGTVKIFAAHFEPSPHGAAAGSIATDGRERLAVACADGWVSIDELQISGKRRMPVRDFLAGLRDASNHDFR